MFRRRWSTTSKAFAFLAVVAAVAAYGLVRGYAARLEALRPVVGTMQPVVVAAAPIERGTVLTESMLRVAEIPSSFAPPGALRTVTLAVGETLGSDVAEGEPVTRTRLGAFEAGPVASLVPSGSRAFAVDAGVPLGAVRAGDRVDVYATFGGPHPHTETVATGLEVLLFMGDEGVDATTGVTSNTSTGPSLVLLVSPEEAERLAYATAFADIAISIDGPSGISSG
ncbi:MAG TPA: Flp pilus assembly protein CpaB [Actinomycetota bacterium]|nr:Flp pilus assembly protein CpaB [Actinomycetota bacterium]